jgi:tetratricopeptide (TPR) repeat protein
VIQLMGQFVPVKVNAEKEGVATAKQYGVRGFPTILFIDPAGKVADKIVGYLPPPPFADRLKLVARAHAELPRLEARHKANPGSVEVSARLAEIYAGRGEGARAEALLQQAEKADPQNATGHLTKAYNAVGDYFQERNQFDRAIALFRRAATTGKDPADVGYARLSIAVCHLSQSRPEDAKQELEATIAMPNLPPDQKRQAERLLEQAKGRGGR